MLYTHYTIITYYKYINGFSLNQKQMFINAVLCIISNVSNIKTNC